MTWILVIVGVLVAGYFILGKRTDSPIGQKLIQESKKMEKQERHFDVSLKNEEKILELMGDHKYRQALTLIEKTLAEEDFDHTDDIYADCIVECFSELASEKKPQALLDFYNKTKSEGKAISYAEQHNQLAEFVDLLSHSLNDYPQVTTKAAIKKAITFIQQDHPLILGLQKGFDAIEFLDYIAESFFESWEVNESNDLDHLIKSIETVLDGGEQPKQTPDPKILSCTCKDWLNNRSHKTTTDPQRLCKHLVRYFQNHPAELPKAMELFRSYLEHYSDRGEGMPLPREGETTKYREFNGKGLIISKKNEKPEWVNFLFPEGQHFGYSLGEKRWARKNVPPEAELLEKIAIGFSQE